jgi:hypothetical protein
MEKIFLGKLKDGEPCFITKHQWDCGWYWALGYVGNKNSHYHFSSFLEGNIYKASDLFVTPKFTDDQWWIIRDLFVQAYALKAVAAVYRYGGHQTTLKGVTDVIQNQEKADAINKDLELILNTVWEYMSNIVKVYNGKN